MTKSTTRIVFMGTPAFATTILRRIVEEGFSVVGCVTATDKPAGRGQKLHESDVKQYAKSQHIPIYQPDNLKDPEFRTTLIDLAADLFIVVAFRMLPKTIWEIPPLGTINLHGSLLPDYRGAAPINWAIMNGETKTGVTSFFINEKIDTGDILLQAEMDISPNETAGEVHDRMMHLGAEVIIRTINGIVKQTIIPQKQDLLIQSSPKEAPKIFKNDCIINQSNTIEQIHNFIRGLSPYPGAWLTIHNQEKEIQKTLKVFRTRIMNRLPNKQIRFKQVNQELHLELMDGTLAIDELQLEGKKRLDAPSFLAGFDPEKWKWVD